MLEFNIVEVIDIFLSQSGAAQASLSANAFLVVYALILSLKLKKASKNDGRDKKGRYKKAK